MIMKRVDECGPNTSDTNWLANVYVYTTVWEIKQQIHACLDIF